ncbi:uncharacterized protein LOC123300206 [Chrysoperla carnea]|uniref:uncharacterized protein LOC123300206 n=1 Tax=Chrysoperla carnea TaxID=189513 RepID=UPI001D0972E7|nr:uncharacterized protein LOC123300206 [Chrysoperla carnea]
MILKKSIVLFVNFQIFMILLHTSNSLQFGLRQSRTVFPNRRAQYQTNPLTIHKIDPLAQQFRAQNMDIRDLPVSPTIIRGRYDLDPPAQKMINNNNRPRDYVPSFMFPGYDAPVITRRTDFIRFARHAGLTGRKAKTAGYEFIPGAFVMKTK